MDFFIGAIGLIGTDILKKNVSTTLYTNFYTDARPERQRELETCLKLNLNNRFIDRVVALVEPDSGILDHPKLQLCPIDQRPTFNTFFEAIGQRAVEGDVSIIANTDIFFGWEAKRFSQFNLDHAALALTRWDCDRDGAATYMATNCSQDAWVICGKPKAVCGDFQLGQLGCDNRIAHELRVAGYGVLNPSKTVVAYHLHLSDVRNYKFEGRVKGEYLFVDCCPGKSLYRQDYKKIVYFGYDSKIAEQLAVGRDNFTWINWQDLLVEGANLDDIRKKLLNAGGDLNILQVNEGVIDNMTCLWTPGRVVYLENPGETWELAGAVRCPDLSRIPTPPDLIGNLKFPADATARASADNSPKTSTIADYAGLLGSISKAKVLSCQVPWATPGGVPKASAPTRQGRIFVR